MHNIATLNRQKSNKEKICALALYDASFAAMAASAGVEILLVGDSLGMVIQGHSDTLKVSIQNMAYHTACVAQASGDTFVVADMPFATYCNEHVALKSAATLMRSGAHMVKIEGGIWLKQTIQSLVNNGIPVCGHLGLTPQSVHKIGGFKVQGTTDETADAITQEAIELERAGATLLVLECIPSELAKVISSELAIPVIGIGAGVDTDGQVLVVYDLLGISQGRAPRFVKNFMESSSSIEEAICNYVDQVGKMQFPAAQHCY